MQQFVVTLADVYGWKLLGMLAFAQWLLKGFVWGFSLSAMEFLLRDHAVSGPQMQVYRAVAMLPWAMKPLFGLLSDSLPVMGFRKAPYIIITSFIAAAAHLTIGLSPGLPVRTVVACLLLGCMQVSMVDLLSEARYAEKIREHPEHGPDLMTYVWGGITLGNLLATGSVGFVIEHFGASAVYLLIAAPACLVIVPTCCNWLEEEQLSSSALAAHRAKLWQQKELLLLVALTGAATITLACVGLLQESPWINLAVAVAVCSVLLTAFLALLRPVISLMNCFFFIQTCCVVDISGASFYFFTDDQTQYPEGPHFSKIFFVSGMGVSTALLNLVGMWIYNRYMKHWRYQGLFVFANVLLCLVSLMGLLVYARLNVVLGLPDSVFVLGTWGAWGIVHMWMWLPGIVLLSHLCPSGVEATMYALLAGCHNLGLSVASYAGACLLQHLGVAPDGRPQEQQQFDNLWVAGLVQAVLPVFTLFLLPFMIPDARQTDRLLEENTNAVDGSPWQRLTGQKPASGDSRSSHYGATSDATA